MENKDMLRIAAQVVVGIVVVAVVYWLSLWVLQRDQLVADMTNAKPKRQHLVLLSGYVDASLVAARSWSTVNRDAFDFAPVRRSFNRKGGAQFSYSMWVQLTDTTPQNVAGRTLLLRGDNKMYDWSVEKVDGTAQQRFHDVMVKCPRIRFGSRYDEIVVEFNTLESPSSAMVISSSPGGGADGTDASLRHNALKLIQARWAMLTFTFEDNVAINEFEDGIIVRFFLNDLLYKTERMRSTFRQNSGDVFIMPASPANADGGGGGAIKGARIGDVQYINYALPMAEVRTMYKRGPPRHPSRLADSNRSEPLYLSEYNKLDIYNT